MQEEADVKQPMSYKKWMLAGALLALIGAFFATGLGAMSFSPGTVLRVVFSRIPFARELAQEPSRLEFNMIWKLRIPRVLLGLIVGAALGICGVAMQALVRNKLADPFILGVSSGASATASLFMVFGVFSFFGRYALPLSAFLGALFSIVFVFAMAHVNGRISITRMLLSGVAVAMIMDAVTSFVAVSAPNAFSVYNVSFWLSGSLAGAKWETLALPGAVMLLCGTCLMAQHRALDVLVMGEEAAGSLGVSVRSTQQALMLLSSLLAGVAISVSGSVGFIGMIVPHLSRILAGASHKRVLPLSALLGGILVVWADVAARMIAAPEEIPVGLLTALIGAPFFLVILKKRPGERTCLNG
jgi:iron complex transport system permease protein